jgi:hypothetical protein
MGNKPTPEAMRHNPNYGIMTKFVQGRSIEIDLLIEGRLRRHLHKVFARTIEGARSADAEIRARRGNQILRDGNKFTLGQRRCINAILFGQSVTLRDVENDEAFEEGNRARITTMLGGTLLFGLGGEAVSIADRYALLALTNASARCQRLPKGQPSLIGIGSRDDCAP